MKIKSIKKAGIKPTWDLSVPGEEHYIMKNGCVSHNTSQILGNNECFEPYTSNIYSRRTLSGEFMCINRHLVKDLIDLGIWSENIKQQLIANKGSVQNIPEIPDHIKSIYKTVWEISQKVIIDMSADRGAFICQSQSLNIFLDNPNFGKLTSMHFYGWKKGLKTGMYYLRTKAALDAKQVTVSVAQTQKTADENVADMVCSINDPDNCEACGS